MEGTVVLADYAQVHAGKLNVVGAGINLVGAHTAEAPHKINLHAAILIIVPWQSHNQAHKLTVSLGNEDGGYLPIAEAAPGVPVEPEDEGSVVGQFNAGRGPIMTPGDDSIIPLAVPIQVAVPSLGAYRVILKIDGTEIAVARFRVLYTPQLVTQG
ncbi:MAG: hypothetical protein M3Z25_16840 [Actinomycetota bacterium]|nr:hypothetical protein [Actinomycetota bacterium]